MTSFSDLKASRVVYLAEGRKKGVVEEFLEDLQAREVDPAKIQVVCCDMWDPYLNEIGMFLKNAPVVFDRFHVMGQINLALETVRRREQRENTVLKKSRFLWLRNPKNLTEKQKSRLASLTSQYLKTTCAHRIKLALARFWEIRDPAEAITYLKRWYNWATHSRLYPIIRAARTIKRYWHGIINYLKTHVTNETVEGLNSKIKTAMKRAYEFKHVDYLRTIVYLVAVRLSFSYPQ